MGVRIIRLEASILVKGFGGGVTVSGSLKEQAQFILRLRKIGLEFNAGLQLIDGFFVLIGLLQRCGEVIVGLRILRIGVDCDAKLRDGGFHGVLPKTKNAEVEMGER